MTIPLNMSNMTSFLDWSFKSIDTSFFGSVGMMMVLLIAVVFALLMMFNANKFTVGGFISALLISFGMYAYTTVGWIAMLGFIIGGAILATGLIWLFKI